LTVSDLVVIAFPSEEKAEQVRQKLLDLQEEYLIELGDAVVAVKQPNGRIKLNQLFHTTAAGAVSGTFWGALVGLVFLMPALGAVIGAASGALGGALTDVGINDDFMKRAAEVLQPNSAALFVLIRRMTTDKVLAALQGEGGTVLRFEDLSDEIRAQIWDTFVAECAKQFFNPADLGNSAIYTVVGKNRVIANHADLKAVAHQAHGAPEDVQIIVEGFNC